MAIEKTVAEKHAEKIEALRLTVEDSEYMQLLNTETVQKTRRVLRARKLTAKDKAAAVWAERVSLAKCVLAAPATDQQAIIDSETVLAKATAKAARQGEMEAEKETTIDTNALHTSDGVSVPTDLS